MIPKAVESFRQAHRREHIGPRYSGVGHFLYTSALALGGGAFALSRLRHVTALEWLTVPLAFLFANFVEYHGHRGPMHHRRRLLRFLYERHTMQHHRFYTHEAMAAESTRDFQMVLFPPEAVVYFIGGFLVPPVALLHLVVGPNVAWLFAATGLGYFLTYEWLHLIYHLPEGHPVRRLPFIDRLRRLHLAHHDPALATRYNFNITFPIFDWIRGTRWPGASSSSDVR
jgi:hypothetical protein